jgi:hypothetical protein
MNKLIVSRRELILRNPKDLDEAVRIAEGFDALTWQMRDQGNPVDDILMTYHEKFPVGAKLQSKNGTQIWGHDPKQ